MIIQIRKIESKNRRKPFFYHFSKIRISLKESQIRIYLNKNQYIIIGYHELSFKTRPNTLITKKFEIKNPINTHIFSFHLYSYQTPYKYPTPPPFITSEKYKKILYTLFFFAGVSQVSLSRFSLYPRFLLSLRAFFRPRWVSSSSLRSSGSFCHNHHQPPAATMLPSPFLSSILSFLFS